MRINELLIAEEILIEFNERLKLNSIVIIITPKLFDIPSIKMWSLSRLVVALINISINIDINIDLINNNITILILI